MGSVEMTRVLCALEAWDRHFYREHDCAGPEGEDGCLLCETRCLIEDIRKPPYPLAYSVRDRIGQVIAHEETFGLDADQGSAENGGS